MSDKSVLLVIAGVLLSLAIVVGLRLYFLVTAVRRDKASERDLRLDAIARIFGTGEVAQVPQDFDMPTIIADRAITTIAEDRIDRSFFVAELAQTVSAWQGEASLGIAITGAWGSGKTSTLNLLIEALRTAGESIVIKVDPWSANRRNELVPDIYQQIALALIAEHRRAAKEQLPTARYMLAIAGKFLSLAMYYLDEHKRTALQRLGIALGAPVISPRSTETIYEVQDALASMLRHGARRLVVCFDDIDRLDGAEAAEFLRLVSTLRDLPSMLLVAALNLEKLHTSIERGAGRGGAFMDKIFQLVIPLPPVPPDVLRGLWVESTNAACNGELSASHSDQHFQRVLAVVVSLIRSLREVTRAHNTFVHIYRALNGRIALADIIALAVLVERDPRIVDQLEKHRSALVGEQAGFALSAPSKEDTKRSIEALAVDFEPQERHAVRALLYELFPYARENQANPPGQRHYDRASWERARRIADVRHFDLAISNAVTELDGSNASELYPIIRSAIDERRIDEVFGEYIANGRGTQLLTALQNEKYNADPARAEVIASTLLARSTEFFDERRDLVVNNRLRITWLLNQLLTALPDAKRTDLLRRAASSDRYPFVVLYIAAQEDIRVQADGETTRAVLNADSMKAIQKVLVRKISDEARSGRLFQISYIRSEGVLRFIIERFIAWGEGEGGIATIRKSLGREDVFAEYLRCFFGLGPAHPEVTALNDLIFGSGESFKIRVSRFRESYYYRQLSENEKTTLAELLAW